MLNQQIGTYKIISELGEGGMAMVYLAEKGTLGKQVALKVLKKEFLYNQHIRGRFLSEAKKMINLNHPNIVGVQDLIDESDFVAIELEYVEGKTLKQHLNDHGALPDDEIEHLFKQMLDAVGYIHAKGYIHRDIKPSNFMLTQSGIIKLTDFGIAKNADDANIDYTGTGTGMQMGTPKYMSPEQVRSTKDVDHRSDIYSLGVVLWEMVTGKVPYDIETESTFDVFRKIVDESLEPTNTRWDKIIKKCTNKKIENRYQKVVEIKIEETISEYPNDKTDQIVASANGDIDSTDKKKSYSLKAPIVILFIIVGFVLLKFLIDSYENNINAEDSKKVTVQEQNLPQWKIDFEERWENAVSTENMNNAQNNHDKFSELLTILPEDAEEERNRVQLKLDEYEDILEKEKKIQEEKEKKAEEEKRRKNEMERLAEEERLTKEKDQFGKFKDYRDGRMYKTKELGNQVWMVENLNATTFRNGDIIREAKTIEEWKYCGENKIPAWCYYNNNPNNSEKYGKLYNWYAVSDKRNIAPYGWRVANQDDWEYLQEYIGLFNDFIIKSGHRFIVKRSSNKGYIDFSDIGEMGWYWMPNESEKNRQYAFYLKDNTIHRWINTRPKKIGMAIRCVRD